MSANNPSGHDGWIPDPPDERDLYYNSNIAIAPSVDLWTQHRSASVKVYNQGFTNSCVANATAAAMWYEEKKAGKDTLAPSGPSRLFIYYNARDIDYWRNNHGNTIQDTGSNVRASLLGLVKFGVCSEEDWPFSTDPTVVNQKPPPAQYQQAQTHKIELFYRLDPSHSVFGRSYDENLQNISAAEKDAIGQVILANLRRCLTEGYPVIFAFRYYWPDWLTRAQMDEDDGAYAYGNTNRVLRNIWKDGVRTTSSEGNNKDHGPPIPRHSSPESNDWGAHVVLAIGYNDAHKRVLVHNSWGLNVDVATGSDTPVSQSLAHFWVPYEWVTDWVATEAFWTIRSSKPADFEPLLIHDMERVVKERMENS